MTITITEETKIETKTVNKIDFKLENNVVCICARRGSGKSELLKYLAAEQARHW